MFSPEFVRSLVKDYIGKLGIIYRWCGRFPWRSSRSPADRENMGWGVLFGQCGGRVYAFEPPIAEFVALSSDSHIGYKKRACRGERRGNRHAGAKAPPDRLKKVVK
jgi:hypothetical protein